MRYDFKINSMDKVSAPKATFSTSVNLVGAYPREAPAVDADLKQKIKSLVLAKLNGQVDAVLLDAVITKVLAGMK
jgi:hypothetical protein